MKHTDSGYYIGIISYQYPIGHGAVFTCLFIVACSLQPAAVFSAVPLQTIHCLKDSAYNGFFRPHFNSCFACWRVIILLTRDTDVTVFNYVRHALFPALMFNYSDSVRY
jgi:hypothetical protein